MNAEEIVQRLKIMIYERNDEPSRKQLLEEIRNIIDEFEESEK